MQSKQYCPLCRQEVSSNQRHPNYICSNCTSKATDGNGRRLEFSNIDMSGGYQARYVDTKEEFESHICYVEGIKCYADEYRFGGIIVEKIIN